MRVQFQSETRGLKAYLSEYVAYHVTEPALGILSSPHSSARGVIVLCGTESENSQENIKFRSHPTVRF